MRDLLDRFLAMHAMADVHERGREFESFLNDLFELHDLQPRAAYNGEHEQVDWAFTFDTDDYLLEAKWWKAALQPKEVHAFRGVLNSKAKHTLGLFISVNGFTAGAVDVCLQATPLLFMDGADLMPILEDRIALNEFLHRKRRHAAETGNPFSRSQRCSALLDAVLAEGPVRGVYQFVASAQLSRSACSTIGVAS